MAEAHITIEVRDSAGGVTTGRGTITLEDAAPPLPRPPVISSIHLTPTTLPATGGTVRVVVLAHSPDGLSLTTTATVDSGMIHPVTPGVFDWMVPPA